MQFHTKKAIGTRGYPGKFTVPAGNLLKNASFLRRMLLLFLTFLIVNVAYSQRALKITRVKQVSWDTYSRAWTPWPSEWRSYETGNEPIITLYKLDDSGYNFRVFMKINEQSFSFDVTFAGFDSNNNWSKYKDQNGDEIDISGSTMSKLSQYGWPDSVVEIYLWIYSNNMGFALE